MLKKNITQRRKDDAEKNKKGKFSSTLEAIYEFYPLVQVIEIGQKTYRIPQKKSTLRILCGPSTKLRTGSAALRVLLSLFCMVPAFAGLGEELNIR